MSCATHSYRAALERIAMGISGREKSGLLPNEIRVYTTGMAKPDWELAEELLALVPPAGPSSNVMSAANAVLCRQGEGCCDECQALWEFINSTPATTRPIDHTRENKR